MSSNKKKSGTPKNPKELAAQYRKNFFYKMKLIIDSTCGKDIFPLIPQSVLDDAYLSRSAPFKFVTDANSNISSFILKNAKVILPHMLKKVTIPIPPNNLEISLNDYFTVLNTIIILGVHISPSDFNNADKVKAALQFLITNSETGELASKQMYTTLFSYSLGDSDLRKIIYWYKSNFIVSKSYPGESQNLIIISSTTAENILVMADGILRPAIRVGWALAYSGPDWISLKPSVLGFKSAFADIPLKVYIQSHAINRLLERIDCFWVSTIQLNMYFSLINPKIAYDNNNNLLIEFTYFTAKAGYFRADIVDGIILIRTFLFITNNGTPEGQLLEKITGLQKLDKKYLNIDKLSTFMNSDLDQNEEVQRLFTISGCQDLIELFNNMKSLLTKKDNAFNFNTMLNYMNNNQSNNSLSETESTLSLLND